MNDAQILLITASSIAFVHTVIGPDHYLVFVAMGKARSWGLAKTLQVTLVCGIGHIMGSIIIGAVGILMGAQLASLVEIEGVRGNLAGWALLAFGLVYFAWGIKQAGRSRKHSHVHVHDDVVHDHEHDHHKAHLHVHDADAANSITPWAIFIIFVLGPCEALIPLFMYPAAQQSAGLLISVAAVFGAVTLLTMLACVTVTSIGLEKVKLPSNSRYAHAIAGAMVVVCAVAVNAIGV
jgi:sulfite exporter TauE/SafE